MALPNVAPTAFQLPTIALQRERNPCIKGRRPRIPSRLGDSEYFSAPWPPTAALTSRTAARRPSALQRRSDDHDQ